MKSAIFYGFINTVWTLTGENICRYNESTVPHCCSGFKEVNNICIKSECSPGFIGPFCNITCPEGIFGQRCYGECTCNNETEYCHHVCGCVVKPLQGDNKSTETNETTTAIPCVLTNKTIKSSTTKNSEVSSTNGIVLEDKEPLNFDNLLILLAVAVMCLSLVILVYCCIRSKMKGQKPEHSAHFNALYGEQQEGGNEAVDVEPGPSTDSVYDSYDQGCYSTLTLRVNVGSVANDEETSETLASSFHSHCIYSDGRRMEDISEGKSGGLLDGSFTERDSEEVDGVYESTISMEPSENALSGLYDKPLLRQSAERRFDLMPAVEDYSPGHTCNKDHPLYELVSNQMNRRKSPIKKAQ